MSDQTKLQRLTPWTTIYPRERSAMAKLLREASVNILEAPDVKLEKPVINAPNLRNWLLYARNKLPNTPAQWKTYIYLNDKGTWEGICANIGDIVIIARALGISATFHNEWAVLPNRVAGVAVDKNALEQAINTSVKQDMTDYGCVTQEPKEINGIPFIHITQLSKKKSVSDEALLKACYAQNILQKVIDDNSIIDRLPDTVQKLYEKIFTQQNQWLQERPKNNQHDRSIDFTKDERLKPKSDEVWTLLTKTNIPNFCRYNDNPNKNTFDYVEVRFGIRSKETLVDRTAMIKRCMPDIIKIGFQKIKNAKHFPGYGIPISFLKATRYTITAQSELIVTYELRIN